MDVNLLVWLPVQLLLQIPLFVRHLHPVLFWLLNPGSIMGVHLQLSLTFLVALVGRSLKLQPQIATTAALDSVAALTALLRPLVPPS
jgi:hypothetical protein